MKDTIINYQVWVVVHSTEIDARSVEKVFGSKEKADTYVGKQEKGEMLPNPT
jgi:hypothetical protein